MEGVSEVDGLLNNINSTDIEVGKTVEVCSSFFHLGDKFSSYEDVHEAVKNVENKTGTKFWLRDAKKITTFKTKLGTDFNQALIYRILKYTCVQGGRKPSIHVSRGNRVRVRFNTSTLRNGCQAHVKFGISLDKHYLEVKSCSDVHNHEISKIRARTKVCQILASEGLDASLWQNGNQNGSHSNTQGTTGPPDIPESNTENMIAETSETEDKMILIRKRADKAVEDLVREKKRSNDLKEKLLEESQKRNQYLEALLRIKCIKYNQTFEELIKD